RRRIWGSRSATGRSRHESLAHATHERDVLLVVDEIRDGRSHTSLRLRLKFEELLAVLGMVGDEASVGNNLKHQIPTRRESAAEAGASYRGAPSLGLRHGVPGQQD